MKCGSDSKVRSLSLGLPLGVALLVYGLAGPIEFNRSISAIIPGVAKKFKPKFKNWGLVNDRTNSHISAVDAWKIEQGSRKIVVAVIDTGLDHSHPDLKKNIWNDPRGRKYAKVPKSTKVYGWDFVTNQPNPKDDHGHGTHVAGIIGAISNPKAGISGVAHKVSIMAVKYYSEANPGTVNLRNTIRAINYAIDNGARIINYSGGGPEYSREEYLALKKAEARGIFVVAAAGNEKRNTDLPEHYYYPAAYGLSNTISVAAIDINNKLLSSSNWGVKKVDVAAPGENIYSTMPRSHGTPYGYMSGTSQATAFVSGLAALLLSKNPKLKPQELKKIISSTVDPLPTLLGKIRTGGKVNAYKALLSLVRPQKVAPRSLTDYIGRSPVSIPEALRKPEPSAQF